MVMPHVIPATDRDAFLRCRRAWDFAARERRNRAPAHPAAVVDLGRTLRDALAVYYFPGMWDWPTSIVLPLVRTALTDSVAAQRAEYGAAHGALLGDQEHAAAECAEIGARMLEAYLGWAPGVEEFAPSQVVAEFDVQVPDPRDPGHDLVAPGGRAVRFRDRVDLLVIDEAHRYWMVEHRLVDGPWPDPDVLRRDDRCLSWCWAWEQAYPGMRIEGTIYNELRVGRPDAEPPPPGPRGTVPQTQGTYLRPWSPAQEPEPGPDYDLRVRLANDFRRVQVPRSRTELAAFGDRLADQLLDMADPAVRVYPNPSPHCARCEFLPPCQAADGGGDVESLLAESYRDRDHEPKPGTLGTSTWSLGRGAAPPPERRPD